MQSFSATRLLQLISVMGIILNIASLGLIVSILYCPAYASEGRTQAERQARIQHAQELLGRHYQGSRVRSGEKVGEINRFVEQWVRERLPEKHRRNHKKIARAVIREAARYEFDPVFLLAVIQGESSFRPEMRGALDEIGLMQVRPSTAEWIIKKQKLKMSFRGETTLLDPVKNIQIGAAYLHYLREKFDSHARLYLAAYNMGARNVNAALDKNVWPKDYPNHVMKLYVEFYTDLGVEVASRKPAKI